MFFIISKTLEFLLSPIVWITITFLVGGIVKRSQLRRYIFLMGFTLLYVFTNSFLVNEVFLFWEAKAVPVNSISNYSMAIVLTGVTTERRDSKDKVHFERGADRLLHTVQLYRLGKIRKVMISGGSGSLDQVSMSEALQLKKVFNICGVPDSSIIIEETSRNTHESALNAKKRLFDDSGTKVLLITSAFHIPRAVQSFRKVGFIAEPYPVDFYGTERSFDLKQLIIPSDTALTRWSIVIREVVGYYIYKLMGYLD